MAILSTNKLIGNCFSTIRVGLIDHNLCGIMLFDEYSINDWPGETKALDEFFADKPDVKIKTLPWTNAPAGYIMKEY